jgi:hypothetical protein
MSARRKSGIGRNASSLRGYAVFFFLVCGAVALHASFGRPLWIDEFLHFIVGSAASVGDAWRMISESIYIPNYLQKFPINHGQTGMYMLLDYWLLKLFGANLVALRLPSLASAVWLFSSGIAVLRVRGYGFFWQLLVIPVVFCSSRLMYFAGEARPYMPLAAATVGVLAYYLTVGERRTLPMRFLGAGSVILGCGMHPYFSLYWLGIFLFCFLLLAHEEKIPFSLKGMVKHVNLPLAFVGIIIYFSLSALTWGRGIVSLEFDPFAYIASNHLVKDFVRGSHLSFLGRASWLLLAYALLVSVLCCMPFPRLRCRVRTLCGPVALIFSAFAISAVLVYISYTRGYWILERQWVASMALCAVAFVWLAAETVRLLDINFFWLSRFVSVCLFVCFTWKSVSLAGNLYGKTAARLAALPVSHEHIDTRTFRSFTNEQWVGLANRNVSEGGPVWSIFRFYYEDVEDKR